MAISVQIPTSLRAECQGSSHVEISATTISEVLSQLQAEHPQLFRCICDETGAVRRHINLFVNDALIHRQNGLGTKLNPKDTLFIMTAVSGG
ncbi:molybdopterin synthase sulfur carrier subunit [bacterium]|nr:molybdopterin synthase sulfur carrier subunit [bacterium]